MKEIFVFGSNLSGIHGAGAAKRAYMYHAAVWGQGEGLHGDSYALPTKGHNITFMPIGEVVQYVEKFLRFAAHCTECRFKVTRVGCGLAGFKDEEIAPLFRDAPANCTFDSAWLPHFQVLGVEKEFWGTF